MLLSISLYHGLTTLKHFLKDGSKVSFGNSGYLEYLGSVVGIGRTRIFAEHPWFWRPDLQPQKPVFNHNLVVLPYARMATGVELAAPTDADADLAPTGAINYDWDTMDTRFVQRIGEASQIARKWKFEILLTFVTGTQPYGVPFWPKMGYPQPADDYTRADFPEFQASGAWGRFQNYFADLAGLTTDYPQRYLFFEPYNEHGGGSLVDELRGISLAVQRKRDKPYKIQLNFPHPIKQAKQIIDDFGSIAVYMKWLHKLMSGMYSFRVNRFSFHGAFTPQGCRDVAALLRAHGHNPGNFEMSTDAATPWKLATGKYLFTELSYPNHFKKRIEWNLNAANIEAVTQGHCEVKDACRSEGFAVFDVQDLIKWSEDCDYTKSDIRDFHAKLVTA